MAFTPFIESDQPTMAAFNKKFLDAISTAIDAGIKVEAGSYVGTGTYGPSNPNSLTFEFEPKFVLINGLYSTNLVNDTAGSLGIFINGMNQYTVAYSNSIVLQNEQQCNFIGRKLSWNSTNNAPYMQLNGSGHTYYYIAIG